MFKIISQKDHQKVLDEKSALEAEVNKLKGELNASFSIDSEDGKKLIKQEIQNALTELTAQHEKAVADLKAGYEKQISELKVNVESAEASSEAKAISIAAQVGIKENETPKVNTSGTDVLSEYRNKQGAARVAYFEKHKEAIQAALNKSRQ